MKELVVKKIPSKEAYPFILNIHYAKRITSISYAFILLKGLSLIFNIQITLDTYLGSMLVYGVYKNWFCLYFKYIPNKKE